jgi:hypothetical protein
MQILKSIADNNSWESLQQFDGTFSCLYYDRDTLKLYLFRNEISPMFIDEDFNISSTKFKDSKETEPNKVFKLDITRKLSQEVYSFKTVENPYFFMEQQSD